LQFGGQLVAAAVRAEAGVLGGIFNALIAPQIFGTVLEYPIVLVVALLLRPPRSSASAPTPVPAAVPAPTGTTGAAGAGAGAAGRDDADVARFAGAS